MTYIQNNNNDELCAFCVELGRDDGPVNLIIHRGKENFVILNRYPYTSGHLMVVPYKHLPTIEGLESSILYEMMELSNQCIGVLREIYHPQGFNVGMNIGEAAGAGILDHVHLHIVPRWLGDTNFMSSLGETRVVPELLEESFFRIKKVWEEKTTIE